VNNTSGIQKAGSQNEEISIRLAAGSTD